MRAAKTDPVALREEQRRIRRLRLMVDLTSVILRDRPLSRQDAELAVENLRGEVLTLFPDKEHVFDLIYRPRFGRLIAERFGNVEKDILV